MLGTIFLFIPECGMDESFLLHMIDIVENHLRDSRHRQLPLQPRQRHIFQVFSPDLFIVRPEINIVERGAEPIFKEFLKICRLRPFIFCYLDKVVDNLFLKLFIEQIHMVFNRIRYYAVAIRIHHALVVNVYHRVSVGLYEIRFAIQFRPEPFKHISSF